MWFNFFFFFYIVVSGLDDFRRFKRVGPNAMRGRGIGTARGRATIMRGLFHIFLPDLELY